jgi:hypothetical protein
MAFTNLTEAESALEQVSNEIYAQLKDCTPYQLTEQDYRMLRADPHGDLIGGDVHKGVERMAARALANRYGFTDENLMVIARDFILYARSQADEYCARLQSVLEEETQLEFSGISGLAKRLRSKIDPSAKIAADSHIQERAAGKKAAITAEFDDALRELYQDTLAQLREAYGKGC